MQRLERFFKNALILGGTGIFMRVISVAFNAYVAKRIGAEGMGLFSLISSVYFFGVTLATSGIHLAVTMLVSEELEHDDHAGARAAVKTAVKAALCFGGAAAALLFFGAGFLSERVLGDSRTYSSLRAFAAALPFIALSNVFQGYFSAVRRVAKNASAGIAEQFVKIAITVSLLVFLAPRGVEYACLSLVIGTAVSEALSFLYLLIFYLFDRKRHLSLAAPANRTGMARRMLSISLPIALSSYLRSGLVTIEHILIPIGLEKSGADYASALASYGTIHGMALPLVLFPSAICATFAGLIVPEFSELSTRYGTVKGNRHICYIVRRALCGVLFFSIGVAGILFCFASPLGTLVYGSAEAGYYIRLFAPLVPVMYLDTSVDGMLKGLGQQVPSMIYNIVDASLSVLLVWTLLPQMGIRGYVYCVFITEIINMALSLHRLLSVTDARLPVLRPIAGSLFCILGATSVSALVFRPGSFAQNALVATVFGILLTLFCYLLFLRGTQSVSREEVRWLRGIRRRNSSPEHEKD